MNIVFRRLHEQAVLPARATDGAIGYDLAIVEEAMIGPKQVALLPTGLALAERLPDHLELQIRPRSSLYKRHGLIIPNSPGTIDPDYTGEIMVQVLNMHDRTTVVHRGVRVAQLVFNLVEHPNVQFGGRMSTHERAGFGSTGV